VPFVVVASAAAGLFVATPVVRMRGDYLAIVTLGFGEIARLLFLSDWLTPTFGGAQGVTRIPNITLPHVDVPDLKIGGLETPTSLGGEIRGPQAFLYLVVVLIAVVAYVSYALQRSRIGRAWMAMREDESVAEAMGVNIVNAKLSAFVIGAVMAGLGGALFAANIKAIYPSSFEILVSIIILVTVIVGGMASVPGVMLGALVLVALPEMLREFEEYRLLIYGALLIFMMLRRPEGLIPSQRRAQELHEEDVAQDAWLRTEAEQSSAPADSGNGRTAG
jgi:branched-chain amino acid transport system permease protein